MALNSSTSTIYSVIEKKTDNCIGFLDANLEKKLNLPSTVNEVHICWLKGNCCQFRLQIKNIVEIENFMKQWMEKSNIIWRVNKTDPTTKSAGFRNIYWKEFRCHKGNTKVLKQTKNIHKKHTNCQAKMTVTIRNVPFRCRSSDTHLPKYPTIIKIKMDHNHKIDDNEYLKQKPVTEQIRQKFIRLFKNGYTPTSALKLHKIDLKTEYSDRYEQIILDHAICPDIQWCYRLHTSCVTRMLINERSEVNDICEELSPSEEIIVLDYKDNESNVVEVVLDDGNLRNALRNELIEFTNYVSRRLEVCDELLPALMAFNHTWRSFNEDSQLINSLNNFGKSELSNNARITSVHSCKVKKIIRIKPER